MSQVERMRRYCSGLSAEEAERLEDAIRDGFVTKPLPRKRERLDFHHVYSASEFARIQCGFVPRESDDRWLVLFDAPRLYIYRSWTGFCTYVATFRPEGEGYRVTDAWVNRNPKQHVESDSAKDARTLEWVIDFCLLGNDGSVSATKQSPNKKEERNEVTDDTVHEIDDELEEEKPARTPEEKMERARLGAWGELLVQADLLWVNINSARMTTDDGVDLIAFTAGLDAFRVQVKTRRPRTDKKTKKRYYSFAVALDQVDKADLFAFVMRDQEQVITWYLSRADLNKEGLERRNSNAMVFRMYLEGRGNKFENIAHFEGFKGREALRRFLDSRGKAEK